MAEVEGTYRLFSNSKTFAEVGSGYWATDAIDFVTSHEFFNGTGNGVFSPDALMTRSMLVTVLYRIDGEKTAASSGFAAEGELQKISSRETGQAQIETLGTFSVRLSYEDERFTLLDIQLDN